MGKSLLCSGNQGVWIIFVEKQMRYSLSYSSTNRPDFWQFGQNHHPSMPLSALLPSSALCDLPRVNHATLPHPTPRRAINRRETDSVQKSRTGSLL